MCYSLYERKKINVTIEYNTYNRLTSLHCKILESNIADDKFKEPEFKSSTFNIYRKRMKLKF